MLWTIQIFVIENLLTRCKTKDIVYVSPSSVYRVLKENELISERKSRKKRKADGKIKVSEPNELWHTDITYIPVEDVHAYLISILDDHSRYVIHSELCRTMTAEDMQRVLSRALYKADLFEEDPENRPTLISDNGTQMVAKTFT